MLRGDGLRVCVAREPTVFQMEFVDASGQMAHAEEVDCYVERLRGEALAEVISHAGSVDEALYTASAQVVSQERREAHAEADGGAVSDLRAERVRRGRP